MLAAPKPRASDGAVPRRSRLPAEAVRDLIGIVRSLYATAMESGAGERHLNELRQIGIELVQVLELAKTGPGTMGHVAAWDRAERAAERLGRLVQITESLQPVVSTAVRRALGRSPSPVRRKDSGRH